MTSREKQIMRWRILQARLAHSDVYNNIAMVGQTLLILNSILLLIAIFSESGARSVYTLIFGIFGILLAITLVLFNVNKENYGKKVGEDQVALTSYLVGATHLPHRRVYLLASDWASLPLTLDRKKLLLEARIPFTRALDPDTCLLTEEDLLIIEALHRDTAGSP